MKKVDLHIHSVATISDVHFEFSLTKLTEYVNSTHIDGIAITNHNIFDIRQYKDIVLELNNICTVLPGIEINIGCNAGHLICITDIADAEDFAVRCAKISAKITSSQSSISVEELKEIFPDLRRYLWIPHYEKKPSVDKNILMELKHFISCGEVPSIKKFVYCVKDNNKLTPVYFSDYRPTDSDEPFPVRQTYFDVSEINVNSLKCCLADKTKVVLSEADGNTIFEVIPGLPLSTGLNVVIGERSSGKSYMLNKIFTNYQNVKYIRQFELLETDPSKAAKEFTEKIAAKKRTIADQHFELFASVVNIVKDISLQSDENKLDEYITSLIKHAKDVDRADMFSKCKLYSETEYSVGSFDGMIELIYAVEKLLCAQEYKDIIEKHVQRQNLIALYRELIAKYSLKKDKALKKQWVNGIALDIKRSLQSRTAATRVTDVDFYDLQLNRVKVAKFNKLATELKKEQIIDSNNFGGFTVQIKKKAFLSPQELKAFSGKRDAKFSDIFASYQNVPYFFLEKLQEMKDILDTDYYQYFANVEYSILNEYGFAVSGGERAEFNLLQQINDAHQFDMLLIDEPESSFDNLFLKNKVNLIIKELSRYLPVIIVTHNNTVGESIKPDFIVHTVRCVKGEKVTYQRYYGLPSNKELVSANGEKIKNVDALLNCLEAGEIAYTERRQDYEMLKN